MKHKCILTSIAMAALVLVSLCAVGASTLSVSAAQGSSANVQAADVVGAPVGAGAPAVYAESSTVLDLFIRGADNALYVKTGTLDTTTGIWTWSTATSLGGIMASAPSAISSTSGVVDVFYRGSGGAAIWEVQYQISTKTLINWAPIGGAGSSAPSACSWGLGRTDVFVQGSDGHLWQKTREGTTWTGWQPLGGVLTSAPAATASAQAGNQIGVFARGSDSVVWYKLYDGIGWQSWIPAGGLVYPGTSPTAYNWGQARIGWFVMGTDQNLWHNSKSFTTGGATYGYENLGGVLTSSPGATSSGTNTINVFVRGSTGDFSTLWQKSYDTTRVFTPPYTAGWSDWKELTFP
jgi:hypothetical protein